MLKRIRDFIYDINDIFVALLILLVAAGIIFWRSTTIMAYPQYLAEKNPPANTAEVDFSDIDLTPEDLTPITDEPVLDPNTDENGEQGQEDPNGQTQPGEDQQPDGGNGQEQQPDNQGHQPEGQGAQNGTVTATIEVVKGDKWSTVIKKIIDAGLMKADEETAFRAKLSELGLDGKLMLGKFELTNTSYEDMIKKLCKQ